MNANILILSAGRRVELLEAFRTALHERAPGARVLAADIDTSLSAACHLADQSFTVPRIGTPGYIDALLSLCREQKVGMLIPTIDTELLILSHYRDHFIRLGVAPIIADETLIEACRDKRLTAKLFTELTISTPVIYPRDALVFPCFCKPYDGSSGLGASVVSSPHCLTEEMLHNEKNIFMELIGEGYQEYSVDVYYDRCGRLRCLVPRQRLEVRAGEVSKCITRRGFVHDYLAERLSHLKGARGCITVQLFYNHRTRDIKALEINPRFGGGFPLADAAGAHYPAWLIDEYFLGRDIDFHDSWDANLMMLRYDAKVLVRSGQ